MTFKIEKDVPVPPRVCNVRYQKARAMIEQMEVGDMAKLYGENRDYPSNLFHTAAKMAGAKIAYRTLKNISGKPSLCVWRIA